jgi:very-short-patch-repair endonuclease
MGDLPWPFIGSEALAARAIPERAMRELYEAVYPGIYVPWGIRPSARQRAVAAWLWSRRRGIIAGQSAAAMLGAKWVDDAGPAELIYDNRKPPSGITVWSDVVTPAEVVQVDGMAVTSAARTAFDLGRHVTRRVAAVQRLDALAAATDVKVVDVEAVMAVHPGARGLPRLRTALALMDGGAESPQETAARLALVDAGLPAPRTQVVVCNAYGDFIARLDMGYGDVKVGIEYDGPQHWTDPAVRQRDIDKQVQLGDEDWRIVRVSRDLLYRRRATYVGRVVTELRRRGFTW